MWLYLYGLSGSLSNGSCVGSFQKAENERCWSLDMKRMVCWALSEKILWDENKQGMLRVRCVVLKHILTLSRKELIMDSDGVVRSSLSTSIVCEG